MTIAAAPSGQFSFAFAGDVHFMERTATRLAADPESAFGEAAAALSKADLTMVNLETAVTTRGQPEHKSYTFRAPASAFSALRAAGVDIATMANNHGADYGSVGLQDTLAAISSSRFPVVGIGANAGRAYAPYRATINGVHIAVLAASQVPDETLANFSADDSSAGIANAFSSQLIAAVRAAKAAGDTVIVYLHWGTEYTRCPNADQRGLADQLAAAGATAVIGTHAHELQGAGWRSDGVYVAYGLSNYLWWRSFGNLQDDAGLLTLTLRPNRVVAATFAPAHLDARGVPLPATGSEAARINQQWAQDRECAGLAAEP
ncbi:MAG: CapA family protein [Actinomycetota bacterium]